MITVEQNVIVSGGGGTIFRSMLLIWAAKVLLLLPHARTHWNVNTGQSGGGIPPQ